MIYLLILVFPIMIFLNKIIADNSVEVFSVFLWLLVAVGIVSLLAFPLVAWGRLPFWLSAVLVLCGLGFYIWLLMPREK